MAALSREDIVRRWEVEDAAIDSRSVVSRLCAECTQQFSVLVASDAARNRCAPYILSTLDRSRSNLILWSDGHGFVEGNMDEVLANSRFLRQKVFAFLISIANTIITRE